MYITIMLVQTCKLYVLQYVDVGNNLFEDQQKL